MLICSPYFFPCHYSQLVKHYPPLHRVGPPNEIIVSSADPVTLPVSIGSPQGGKNPTM